MKHEITYYDSGTGKKIPHDKETGDETFEKGQIVLVKDHINWQWEQRYFYGFGQNGIILTSNAEGTGNTVGWCHFYKEATPTTRRLAHLPEIGEILYRRHIWCYDDKTCNEENPYWDFTCEIIGPLPILDHEGEPVHDPFKAIREYRILECPEHPEWVGTTESCIMEFHTNGLKAPTGWNIHFATEV
jgi:hypothetical protein